MAYFANVRATTVLQGPHGKYPPITFPSILAAKRKKQADKKPSEQMTDAEKLERWKTAHGVDFDIANASPTKAGDLEQLTPAGTCPDSSSGSSFGADSWTASSEAFVVQGDRHSMAYFANARGSTLLQGPQKKYPPITFPEILAEKKRQIGEVDFDDMDDKQKLEWLTSKALGPEMDFLVEGQTDGNGDPIITPMPKGALPDAMKPLAAGPKAAAAR